jgi:hypothetical protein
MGRVLQWDTLVMSRESAEVAWAAFAAKHADIAFCIRKDLDTQGGHFVKVELPLSDAERVREFFREAARKAVQS